MTTSTSRAMRPTIDPASDRLEVCYYTDPLCSWSWAFEPQWRRLRYELADRLTWSYRMGGLLVDWAHFHDPLNDLRRPSQMGPYWRHVGQLSGMPLCERIWHDDPPSSSLPACLAVKAVERQGGRAMEAYLRRLREAVMLESRNIARPEVLHALAEETAAGMPPSGLDVERFAADFSSEPVRAALREDLKEAAYLGIGRFPTLVLQRPGGRGIMLVGYRPYPALREAVKAVMAELKTPFPRPSALEYAQYWNQVTAREVDEILGLGNDAVQGLLAAGVAQGKLIVRGDLYCAVR